MKTDCREDYKDCDYYHESKGCPMDDEDICPWCPNHIEKRWCTTGPLCKYDNGTSCEAYGEEGCYGEPGSEESLWEPAYDTPEQRVRDYVSYGDGEETVDGLKYDVHKTDMTFLADWGLALEEICKLSAFGAEKYERGGWTEITDPERLKACMLRHYFKEKTGEPDEDSGVMHDVAVAWNALSALQIRLQNQVE